MNRLFTFALLLVTALAFAGCGTPNIGIPQTGDGQAGKGGDAEGSTSGVDLNLLVAQPGSDITNVPIRNEDRTTNAQAAPVYMLDVSGMGSLRTDPLVKSLEAETAALLPLLTGEGPAADAARARIPFARDELATRLKYLRESAEASNLPNLTHLSLRVQHIHVNGVDPEKLNADQTDKASQGVANAIKAAVGE